MKINGGGQPPVPGATGADGSLHGEAPSGLEKAGSAKASAATSGADKATAAGKAFTETLAAPGTTRASEPAATRPGDPAVRALAADLDAGKLDTRAAVDQLIEHVVNLQLGSGASPQAREQVAKALRDAIDSDPLIADKLKRLG